MKAPLSNTHYATLQHAGTPRYGTTMDNVAEMSARGDMTPRLAPSEFVGELFARDFVLKVSSSLERPVLLATVSSSRE